MAPTGAPVEATCRAEIGLLLLLALVVRLRRMLVSHFGFLGRLRRLLLPTHMIVAAMLLGRGAMSFCSLLMMFGSLLVQFLRHIVSSLFERSPRQHLKLLMVPT